MVPPGTTVLIFLEGMFREPQSPRGKDNGGCDVTSILGASGGKGKILGGLDEFWNAFFPQGISQSTLKKENLKWLLMCVNTHSINTYTCKCRCHTVVVFFFLSAGTVKCELGEQTSFLQTFPIGVSGQVKEHLKWLPVK